MLYFKCRDVVGCFSKYLYSLMAGRDTTEDEIVACLRANPGSNGKSIAAWVSKLIMDSRVVEVGDGQEIPCGKWLFQTKRVKLTDWHNGFDAPSDPMADVANFTAFDDNEREMYTMEVWNFLVPASHFLDLLSGRENRMEDDTITFGNEDITSGDADITTVELARLEKAVINAARAYRKSALELGDCKNLPSRAEEYLAYRNRKSQEYQDARRAFYEAVDVMDGKSNTDDSGERTASSAGELARLEKAVLNAARVWANAEPCTNTSALLLNLYRAAKAMNGKSNEGNG